MITKYPNRRIKATVSHDRFHRVVKVYYRVKFLWFYKWVNIGDESEITYDVISPSEFTETIHKIRKRRIKNKKYFINQRKTFKELQSCEIKA